jgi:formylglycine-generating enzyme required for sulfatase activity
MKGAKKMKKITVLSVALLAVGLAAFAETETSATIENVVVRQRWPWKGVVDIDFTVRGKATGVKFVAKYDGVEPFTLAEKDLSGEFAEILEPGIHSVTWNPEKAGLDKTELKNFSVSVEPEDKTYLILNLVDGSYHYAAAEPEGGWLNADPANYQTNIVFRRVPKGTFTMGYSDDLIKALGFSASYALPNRARPMTLTSDYYMAVYKTTDGQHYYVTNAAAGVIKDVSSKKAIYALATYNDMRGSTSEADGICWPETKYDVAPNSVIAAFRKVVKNTFPSDWIIDLPTSAQWVRAARGDTPDNQIWSIGGTLESTQEELTNFANRVGCWVPNATGLDATMQKTLGRYEPNGWGFYDFNGAAFEWGIDWAGWYDTTVNPVGRTSNVNNARSRCGSYKSGKHLCWMAPGYLQSYSTTSTSGYRLCIHLKSLFKDE